MFDCIISHFSHRPLCVENIYNAVQTRIVLKQEQLDSDIPEYEQIFRDDEVGYTRYLVLITGSLIIMII